MQTVFSPFLIPSAVGFALTLNAFLPARSILRIPAFFASWLVNELPIHWALLNSMILVWVLRGATPRDAAFLWIVCLSVASILGAIALWYRGARAGSVMSEALGEHAGEAPWPRFPWRHQLLPFAPARSGVRRVRDVEFARHGKKRLLLDVYLPPGEGAARPAVLQLHGGAWVIGDKREQGLPLLYHLAENGFVCFNANYRLSPGATFPDPLVDVKRAVAWIREHASEYGVDPGFICITGGSAGGHLAALAALTANDPAYQPGFEAVDTRVQGAVPFYGIYCFKDRLGLHDPGFVRILLERVVMKARMEHEPERFAAASPLDRVGAHAPPFFVVHGDTDTLAPPEYARLFVDELRRVSSAPVLHAEIAGAQHAFDVFTSPRTVRVLEGVERFLSSLHRRHAAERPAPDPAAATDRGA